MGEFLPQNWLHVRDMPNKWRPMHRLYGWYSNSSRWRAKRHPNPGEISDVSTIDAAQAAEWWCFLRYASAFRNSCDAHSACTMALLHRNGWLHCLCIRWKNMKAIVVHHAQRPQSKPQTRTHTHFISCENTYTLNSPRTQLTLVAIQSTFVCSR